MMKITLVTLVVLMLPALTLAQSPAWRQATEQELKAVVPDRATVEREQIETELRTASGITDGKGRSIFGVVIITAGYAADGKYTHFFKIETPIRIGELSLGAGDYVFGYQRLDAETLRVMFYRAGNGELVGAVKAKLQKGKGPVRSFAITAPAAGGTATIQLGRFFIEYAFPQ
jgi:hypothetical protein